MRDNKNVSTRSQRIGLYSALELKPAIEVDKLPRSTTPKPSPLPLHCTIIDPRYEHLPDEDERRLQLQLVAQAINELIHRHNLCERALMPSSDKPIERFGCFWGMNLKPNRHLNHFVSDIQDVFSDQTGHQLYKCKDFRPHVSFAYCKDRRSPKPSLPPRLANGLFVTDVTAKIEDLTYTLTPNPSSN